MSWHSVTTRENIALRRIRIRHQVQALVVTAATSFLLMAMMWPLSVSGFRSHASIRVKLTSGEQTQEFIRIFEETKKHCLDPTRLKELIRVANHTAVQPTQPILPEAVSRIRRCIQISASPVTTENQLKLAFSIDGNGHETEQVFVKQLTIEFCNFLSDSMARVPELAATQLKPGKLISTSDTLQTAEQFVDQFDSRIEQAKSAMAHLNHQASKPFRNASHLNNETSSLETVRRSLDSIDTSSLRHSLSRLRNELPGNNNNAPVADEIFDQDHRRQKIWSEYLAATTTPINVQPSTHNMVLMSLISIVLGVIVSKRVNPFVDRGYRSVGQLASQLQTPVVATISGQNSTGLNSEIRSESINDPLNWANQVVNSAQLLLLVLAIVVAGFCTVDAEIRQSFFTNPFHGFSKIVWLFTGR